MNESVLISGASGFVGKHLTECLLKSDTKVIALYYKSPRPEIFDHYGEQIKWVQADLLTDNLSEYLDGVYAVYHLAAKYLPGNSDQILRKLYPLNVVGTKRLVEAAVNMGVNKIIHVSSVAACEMSNDSVITEDNGWPVTSYGISKLISEAILQKTAHNKMKFIIFRPTALFGENHFGSIFEMVKTIKKKMFFIIGNGKNNLNFFYIKDFTEILKRVKDIKKIENQIYISADTPKSLSEIVNFIRKELGYPPTQFYIPKTFGVSAGIVFDFFSKITKFPLPLSKSRVKAMTRDVCYSAKKLKTQIPDDIHYDVYMGLTRTINWFRSQGLI